MLAFAQPDEQKLETIDRKIDQVIEGQGAIGKQIQEIDPAPLAGRQ